MILNLTQKYIDSALVAPEGKAKQEIVDDTRSGLYVLVSTKSPGQGTYFWRTKNSSGISVHLKIGKTTDISLAAARAEVKRLRAEQSLGTDHHSERKKQKAVLTLEEFYEQHLKPFCQPRKRSWARDEQLYRIRIKPKFGRMRLNQITRHQIQTFHTGLLEEGLSPASADLHLKFIRHAINLAIDWNLLDEKNVASRIPLYNKDNRVNNIPSEAELYKLMNVLQTDDNRPICLIAMFLIATGLRVGEALSSQWSDVDFENRLLLVRATNSKSGRQRSVPLNEFALSVLKQLGTERFSHVFTNLDTQRPYTTIAKVFDRLRKKAGVPKLRGHDLRHLAASLYINSGASLYLVQQVLGHSNPSVTERYAHLSQRTLHEASNKASAMIQLAMKANLESRAIESVDVVLAEAKVVEELPAMELPVMDLSVREVPMEVLAAK